MKIKGIEIDGFVGTRKCKKCGTTEIYYEKYDAFFCKNCNEWLETKCKDTTCEFCSKRREKPLK